MSPPPCMGPGMIRWGLWLRIGRRHAPDELLRTTAREGADRDRRAPNWIAAHATRRSNLLAARVVVGLGSDAGDRFRLGAVIGSGRGVEAASRFRNSGSR